MIDFYGGSYKIILSKEGMNEEEIEVLKRIKVAEGKQEGCL